MFTNTDYDKLKQIMAESPEKEALIQKLLASHRATISMISHEIRNPLTLVYSTLQLIESQHPEVMDFHYWDALQSDILYMNQLLEELSQFNNGNKVSFSTIDFQKFLKQVVLTFAIDCNDTNIEFASYIDPDITTITADALKLREVFLNLLRNAKEAIPDYGSIYLDAHLSDSYTVITVHDSGIGIPAEHLEHIFTPFVTYKENGTGLGLAICKRIIESHQGEIMVTSVPEKGTTFTIRLPA